MNNLHIGRRDDEDRPVEQSQPPVDGHVRPESEPVIQQETPPHPYLDFKGGTVRYKGGMNRK